MGDSQLLGILLIAMIAGVILFRLYTVLGRRTGNEREPQERFRPFGGAPSGSSDKVVALPDRSAAVADRPTAPADKGLVDVKLADRSFETEHFLDGARQAYEMIVTAFAARDRNALKPLLSDEVYAAFDSVMHGHEDRNETVRYAFEGFRSVQITHAEMKGRFADVTVEFAARFVSSTIDASGTVIDGDPEIVRDVIDVWTFARDTRSNDPNWVLVATSGGS
ncbi:MAG TPA: Tim44/TimA family putative adaptor protein [Rhizomicrobium sp.]|jgi:predicted lipid-binding transport protein (Tim44 family)